LADTAAYLLFIRGGAPFAAANDVVAAVAVEVVSAVPTINRVIATLAVDSIGWSVPSIVSALSVPLQDSGVTFSQMKSFASATPAVSATISAPTKNDKTIRLTL
jgi:hypothetical protein